jgi:hypothetical protein
MSHGLSTVLLPLYNLQSPASCDPQRKIGGSRNNRRRQYQEQQQSQSFEFQRFWMVFIRTTGTIGSWMSPWLIRAHRGLIPPVRWPLAAF